MAEEFIEEIYKNSRLLLTLKKMEEGCRKKKYNAFREQWKENADICTVHFVAPELFRNTYMSVVKGECLTAIPIREKGVELYDRVFDGWYTEDGEEFDMNQPIYEDVTVYAEYCN